MPLRAVIERLWIVMHVIALDIEPTNRRGGQELSLLDVCRGLAARSHNVSLLYVTEGNLLPEYRQFCTRIEQVGGYMVDKAKPWRTVSRLLADVVRVRRRFTDIGGGVVYANQFDDTPFASLFAKSLGMPSVCHLRMPAPGRLRLQNRDMFRSITRYIAVSGETRRGWIATGLPADRVELVYNGIDPAKFAPGKPARDLRTELNVPAGVPLIAYVGRIDRSKGVPVLLQAIAKLRERGEDVRAVIAGKSVSTVDTLPVPADQVARELGLDGIVHFIGHVADPREVYCAADVTVLPSEWREPFGRTIVESMSCGTPVVASHVGGIPEILTGKFENMLVPPGDSIALADTLARVIRWRENDPTLGDASRKHVQDHFDVKLTVDQVSRVLLETAAHGRGWQPGSNGAVG